MTLKIEVKVTRMLYYYPCCAIHQPDKMLLMGKYLNSLGNWKNKDQFLMCRLHNIFPQIEQVQY